MIHACMMCAVARVVYEKNSQGVMIKLQRECTSCEKVFTVTVSTFHSSICSKCRGLRNAVLQEGEKFFLYSDEDETR